MTGYERAPNLKLPQSATIIESEWPTTLSAQSPMNRLAELHQRLAESAYINLRPFGKALTYSLNNAHMQPDGTAVWEEEDYCSPPLAEERVAVLDAYFDEITVEPVREGEGWKQIETLPKLNAKS